MPDSIVQKHRTIYSSLPMQIFMIHAIKKPLMAVAGLILDKIPEPTKENTWHPNSHNLIDIRDDFFTHMETDKSLASERLKIIRCVFNFIIILYDFDPPWRWMIDYVKDEAFKKKWEPRGYEDTWSKNYTWWKE
jgi:hypothetical protein